MPIPITVDAPTLLGPCADTTSSSSAANAEDPRTRFGLGERRLGDPEPELAASPFPPPAVGLAIGAIGRVIGPGPEASLLDPDAWRPWPGASIGPEAVGVIGFADFAGGPIGEGVEDGRPLPLPKGTPTPIVMARLKAGSKDPPLKTRGGTDGLNGGGYPYAIGGKLPIRGDIADGDIIPTPWGCPYIIPAD